jgi:hypothetical protein
MPAYTCGTCGSDVVVVTSVAGSPWKVACENGHEWLPAGGDVRIEIDQGADERLYAEIKRLRAVLRDGREPPVDIPTPQEWDIMRGRD